MGLVETEALVLKSYPLAEADRIIVFLTRSHGLVRGVAKGAKRLTSRFGGSLEPFSVIRLEYFQSGERELVTIKRSELVESNFDAASDPIVLEGFSYFSDVLGSFTPPSDPDDRVYRMVRGCLETVSRRPEDLRRVTAYFEYWMLRLGGFMPDWNGCSHCGRPLDETEDTALRADFRLSCSNCERVRQQNRLPSEVRALVSGARRLSPADFVAAPAVTDDSVVATSDIFQKMIAMVLGRDSDRRRSD